MKNYFTRLAEDMENIELPELKPFDYFCLKGPWSLNGYVVIPDDFPLDYLDEFYNSVDDGPIGGMTYEGHAALFNGKLSLITLDEDPRIHFKEIELSEFDIETIKQAKEKCVRVFGFDDAHIYQNELSAEEGAKYLAEQLKALEIK